MAVPGEVPIADRIDSLTSRWTGRVSLDRHATYIVAAYLAGAAR